MAARVGPTKEELALLGEYSNQSLFKLSNNTSPNSEIQPKKQLNLSKIVKHKLNQSNRTSSRESLYNNPNKSDNDLLKLIKNYEQDAPLFELESNSLQPVISNKNTRKGIRGVSSNIISASFPIPIPEIRIYAPENEPQKLSPSINLNMSSSSTKNSRRLSLISPSQSVSSGKTSRTSNTRSGSSGLSKSNRKQLSVKFRSHSKTFNNSKIILPTCEIDDSLDAKYSIIKTIQGSTRTAPMLYFIREKQQPFKSYLIKRIEINNPSVNNRFLIESNIYKCVSHLVSNNITPHIITGGDTKICNNTNTNKTYGYIINETFSQTRFNIISLGEFITKYSKHKDIFDIMLHIIFQIVYTLKCFTYIKLKHNDLHLGNILIAIQNNDNITLPNWQSKKNTQYIYNEQGNSIFLVDIGIKVFIIDFDGSNKNLPVPATAIKELNIEIRQPDSFYAVSNIVLSNVDNDYLDLFKIIASIYNHFDDNVNIGLICSKLLRFSFDIHDNEVFTDPEKYDDPLEFTSVNKILIKSKENAQARKDNLTLYMTYVTNEAFTNGILYKLHEIETIPKDTPDMQSAVNSCYKKFCKTIPSIEINNNSNLLRSCITPYTHEKQIIQKNIDGITDAHGKLKDYRAYKYLSKDNKTYVPTRDEMMDPTEYLEYIVNLLNNYTIFTKTKRLRTKNKPNTPTFELKHEIDIYDFTKLIKQN